MTPVSAAAPWYLLLAGVLPWVWATRRRSRGKPVAWGAVALASGLLAFAGLWFVDVAPRMSCDGERPGLPWLGGPGTGWLVVLRSALVWGTVLALLWRARRPEAEEPRRVWTVGAGVFIVVLLVSGPWLVEPIVDEDLLRDLGTVRDLLTGTGLSLGRGATREGVAHGAAFLDLLLARSMLGLSLPMAVLAFGALWAGAQGVAASLVVERHGLPIAGLWALFVVALGLEQSALTAGLFWTPTPMLLVAPLLAVATLVWLDRPEPWAGLLLGMTQGLCIDAHGSAGALLFGTAVLVGWRGRARDVTMAGVGLAGTLVLQSPLAVDCHLGFAMARVGWLVGGAALVVVLAVVLRRRWPAPTPTVGWLVALALHVPVVAALLVFVLRAEPAWTVFTALTSRYALAATPLLLLLTLVLVWPRLEARLKAASPRLCRWLVAGGLALALGVTFVSARPESPAGAGFRVWRLGDLEALVKAWAALAGGDRSLWRLRSTDLDAALGVFLTRPDEEPELATPKEKIVQHLSLPSEVAAMARWDHAVSSGTQTTVARSSQVVSAAGARVCVVPESTAPHCEAWPPAVVNVAPRLAQARVDLPGWLGFTPAELTAAGARREVSYAVQVDTAGPVHLELVPMDAVCPWHIISVDGTDGAPSDDGLSLTLIGPVSATLHLARTQGPDCQAYWYTLGLPLLLDLSEDEAAFRDALRAHRQAWMGQARRR